MLVSHEPTTQNILLLMVVFVVVGVVVAHTIHEGKHMQEAIMMLLSTTLYVFHVFDHEHPQRVGRPRAPRPPVAGPRPLLVRPRPPLERPRPPCRALANLVFQSVHAEIELFPSLCSLCVPNELPTMSIIVPKWSQSPEMFTIVFWRLFFNLCNKQKESLSSLMTGCTSARDSCNLASWSLHIIKEINATQPSSKVRLLFPCPLIFGTPLS